MHVQAVIEFVCIGKSERVHSAVLDPSYTEDTTLCSRGISVSVRCSVPEFVRSMDNENQRI